MLNFKTTTTPKKFVFNYKPCEFERVVIHQGLLRGNNSHTRQLIDAARENQISRHFAWRANVLLDVGSVV